MYLISERLNGQFKSVGRALDERDAQVIATIALRQVQFGADAIDLNIGLGRDDEADAMAWFVDAVQGAVDVPLSIDTPKPEVMEAGMAMLKRPGIMNSVMADPKKMARLFPIAKKHGCDVICLCMDESGVPNDAEKRSENAMLLLATAMEHEIEPDKLLFDPLVMPCYSAQDQAPKVLEAVMQFQHLTDPSPRTVCGLSNLSSGARERSLLNRTFLAMMAASGLTAAICDVEDRELVQAAKASDVVLNKTLYAHDFLKTG